MFLLSLSQNFIPNLKNHLLARILGDFQDDDDLNYSPKERASIVFSDGFLYSHKVLRINYTTYDLRREQDSLNPRTHADIMVLSQEDNDGTDPNWHPYWYGRIIGAFHVKVYFSGLESRKDIVVGLRQVNFLHVRWYGRDPSHRPGWKTKHLPRIGFIESNDPGAFSFLDPEYVVRGVHIMPAFAHGRTKEFLGPSIARHPSENDEDWKYFYVGM